MSQLLSAVQQLGESACSTVKGLGGHSANRADRGGGRDRYHIDVLFSRLLYDPSPFPQDVLQTVSSSRCPRWLCLCPAWLHVGDVGTLLPESWNLIFQNVKGSAVIFGTPLTDEQITFKQKWIYSWKRMQFPGSAGGSGRPFSWKTGTSANEHLSEVRAQSTSKDSGNVGQPWQEAPHS